MPCCSPAPAPRSSFSPSSETDHPISATPLLLPQRMPQASSCEAVAATPRAQLAPRTPSRRRKALFGPHSKCCGWPRGSPHEAPPLASAGTELAGRRAGLAAESGQETSARATTGRARASSGATRRCFQRKSQWMLESLPAGLYFFYFLPFPPGEAPSASQQRLHEGGSAAGLPRPLAELTRGTEGTQGRLSNLGQPAPGSPPLLTGIDPTPWYLRGSAARPLCLRPSAWCSKRARGGTRQRAGHPASGGSPTARGSQAPSLGSACFVFRGIQTARRLLAQQACCPSHQQSHRSSQHPVRPHKTPSSAPHPSAHPSSTDAEPACTPKTPRSWGCRGCPIPGPFSLSPGQAPSSSSTRGGRRLRGRRAGRRNGRSGQMFPFPTSSPCPLPKQHQSKRQLQLIRNVRGPARDSGEGNQAL